MSRRTDLDAGELKRRKTMRKEINLQIATKLREKRHQQGMSQEQVATILGLSFQQIQKYERGTNRISAAALALLADKFSTPIQEFFPRKGEPVKSKNSNVSARRQIDLYRYFTKLEPPVQMAVVKLVRTLVDERDG